MCSCKLGFTGANCERRVCPNSCSHHGKCVSLRDAASEYDGWSLNHTSVYSLWDADIIYGCECDPGWIGYDCSEKACDIGTDPRLTDLLHETVILSCTCNENCKGLFRLRFLGEILSKTLMYNSNALDIANAIMSQPISNGKVFAYSAVTVNMSESYSTVAVCQPNSTTKTLIKFRRQSGDLPAISIYQNRISGGNLHFEVFILIYIFIKIIN